MEADLLLASRPLQSRVSGSKGLTEVRRGGRGKRVREGVSEEVREGEERWREGVWRIYQGINPPYRDKVVYRTRIPCYIDSQHSRIVIIKRWNKHYTHCIRNIRSNNGKGHGASREPNHFSLTAR